ncbi:biotin synthase [Batrachochytrium dendrobatidis]
MTRALSYCLRPLTGRSIIATRNWSVASQTIICRGLKTSNRVDLAQSVDHSPLDTLKSSSTNNDSKWIRNDWTKQEIQAIYDTPLIELLYQAATVHRQHFNPREVQQCTLLSIKTGGCTEDCAYCPQSSKHKTTVKASKLLPHDEVLEAARKAKDAGSTRFWAAWRDVQGRKTNFSQITEYVRQIRGMGMEVCCSLGMLNKEQAIALKEAGLTAYNHNLDTSREFYPNIITTRSYDERLNTISNVRDAGISVCSGGIIGLGEVVNDRVGMLHTLSTLPKHPESVPINALLAVPGTPLENQKPVSVWEMVRMISTARIIMPKAMVRLSAGRVNFSQSEQALCFIAGANSIFTGDKLLTTPNNKASQDKEMIEALGILPKPATIQGPAEDAFLPEMNATQESTKPTGDLVLEN